MSQFNTIQQVQGAAHTFDGVAQTSPVPNHPAGADGVWPAAHRLWAFPDNAHGGLIDPCAVFGSIKARMLQRFTLSLHASTAWRIDIIDEAGGARVTGAWGATSQNAVLGDMNMLLLPGEKLNFVSATYGTISASFAELP